METFIIPAVIIVVVFAILISGYVKAPTDKAYIISGLKKHPKVLIGKAGIKIPFLERKDELILKQISIDIKTNGYIPTHDFIGVDIDAVAKVRMLTAKDITIDERGNLLPNINADENKRISAEMVEATMKNFLNMNEDQIREALTDSLQGNMREIIGTQDLKNLCNDRKTFGDEVQSKAQKDMNALGIWIESCNIQKIEDEKNLIPALGQDNMSQIQKNASIAKAQADRDIAIEQAKADKEANKARVDADTEIAERNNDLEIRKAELKKISDVKKAEANAAYGIQEQEQRKSIEIATVNADIAKQEREVELKQKQVEVTEKMLDADIRKKADAEKYARQQKAEAELFERQRKAEAEKFEQEKEAEVKKIKAEAELFAKTQEAEGIRKVGEAEARAIEAKGLAEAEALDRKAEAMKKYGQAAVIEMIVNKLPEITKSASEPFASIDNFMVIDGGGENSATATVSNLTAGNIASTRKIVKELLGVDISDILKAETFDAKVTKNVNVTGLEKEAAATLLDDGK